MGGKLVLRNGFGGSHQSSVITDQVQACRMLACRVTHTTGVSGLHVVFRLFSGCFVLFGMVALGHIWDASIVFDSSLKAYTSEPAVMSQRHHSCCGKSGGHDAQQQLSLLFAVGLHTQGQTRCSFAVAAVPGDTTPPACAAK